MHIKCVRANRSGYEVGDVVEIPDGSEVWDPDFVAVEPAKEPEPVADPPSPPVFDAESE